MVESGLIADGSLKGVIGGTHYNRCKIIHPAVALSFKIMHFQKILEKYEEKPHESKLHLHEIYEILNRDAENPYNRQATPFELADILDHYAAYTKETLDGHHGSTQKYIMMYVRFIELYQLFERAIRTSDLDLYIHAGFSMCPLFFICNHQNYARWLTRNLDELVNIDRTHPGLRDEFENGALSVRRTQKQFCRTPVDLTLEQTINSNAANKLTGISAFTNSIDARQRWCETHNIRMAVITEFVEYLGLGKSNDAVETNYRSKTFKNKVMKFTEEVQNNVDPFNNDFNPSKLFNLSSGKAASDDVADFLLNFEENGVKQMNKFIDDCTADNNQFDKPLKKNALKNFACDKLKNKHPKFKNINQK